LTIEVQRGWRHGTKIVFAKEGDQGMNKIPADIVFVVKEKPHDRFKRDGDNLLYEAGVSLVKALVGFALEVQTLDDRLLRIPINDTINPVYKKVVQGEGMPNSKTKKFGDLIIGFKTNFPQGLSPEQKKLLKQAFQ
jgi:DnaJ family protein B protein 13